MNSKRHSKMVANQRRRKVRRCVNRMCQFVYDQNKDAIEQHAMNLMLYGRSRMEILPDGNIIVSEESF